MSIVDAKYRNKYKTAIDWLASFVDSATKVAITKEKTTTGEDGTKTTEIVTTSKTRVDLDALFALAKANSLDVAKYEAQRDQKNAPGRLRMTIGNMLRSAATKRHGLYSIDGTWNDAPADFVGDNPKTHNPDGSKIKVEKAAEAPAEEKEGEEA